MGISYELRVIGYELIWGPLYFAFFANTYQKPLRLFYQRKDTKSYAKNSKFYVLFFVY